LNSVFKLLWGFGGETLLWLFMLKFLHCDLCSVGLFYYLALVKNLLEVEAWTSLSLGELGLEPKTVS
jgi:hypothetical protein